MLDEKAKNAITGKFAVYLKENKLRSTPERDTILSRMLSLPEMFSLAELREMLVAESYYVSDATLYNTLNLFCESGILYKHQIGDLARYQRTFGMKHGCQYLVCRECAKVKIVKDVEFMSYVNSKRFNAFTVERYNVYVQGLCNNCLRRIKKLEADKKRN